ncbi:hypothetical protein TL16_g08077, partial [Triparma laevis f. inornata]
MTIPVYSHLTLGVSVVYACSKLVPSSIEVSYNSDENSDGHDPSSEYLLNQQRIAAELAKRSSKTEE